MQLKVLKFYQTYEFSDFFCAFANCFFFASFFNFIHIPFKFFFRCRYPTQVWHCWETANTVATLICIGNLLLFFRIWTAACLGGLGCTLTQPWLQQERGHLKQWRQAEARRQRLETGQSWQMQLGGLILSVSDWSWPSAQLWRHRGPRGSLEVWWGIAIVCCRSDLSLNVSCQWMREPNGGGGKPS